MKDKESLEEELRKTSPFLLKMKKEGENMQVPKNYFKNLTEEVIGKLTTENQATINIDAPKKGWLTDFLENIQWLLQPRPAMAFASVLLLVVVGLFLLNPFESTTEIQGLSEVSLEELELYLDENIEEYDAQILVEENEPMLENGFETEDEWEQYYEEIIEESELKDLL